MLHHTMEEKVEHVPFEGGYYFRSLRPDENVKNLEAKDPNNKKDISDPQDRTDSILEHIRYGSKQDYKSPWLSLTAELNVALAFAGKLHGSGNFRNSG